MRPTTLTNKELIRKHSIFLKLFRFVFLSLCYVHRSNSQPQKEHIYISTNMKMATFVQHVPVTYESIMEKAATVCCPLFDQLVSILPQCREIV